MLGKYTIKVAIDVIFFLALYRWAIEPVLYATNILLTSYKRKYINTRTGGG